MLSSLVVIFEENCDPWSLILYMEIKVLDHASKFYEKYFSWIFQWFGGYWQDAMQVYVRRGIANAVFATRRHTENFRPKIKEVFDKVQREFFCFTLTQTSVLEYLVDEIMSLYNNCKTPALVNANIRFSLKIIINQVTAWKVLRINIFSTC